MKPYTPYTLAILEPSIFCSNGGEDDHLAIPPRQRFYFSCSGRGIAVISSASVTGVRGVESR
jgi:hypothetical protein